MPHQSGKKGKQTNFAQRLVSHEDRAKQRINKMEEQQRKLAARKQKEEEKLEAYK